MSSNYEKERSLRQKEKNRVFAQAMKYLAMYSKLLTIEGKALSKENRRLRELAK